MAQVMIPQKRDSTGQALQLGGAIAGASAGPSGALTGYSAGGAASSFLQKPQPQGVESSGQAAAMARRQQQLAQDNLETLKQAEASLPALPEHLRQEYAPAIIQARMLEEQQRGLA